MKSQVFEYPITIKEFHLDTFGHVNNATYLQIFEEARWEIITTRGFGLKEIVKSGLGPVILEVTLKFKREVRNRERCVIRTVSDIPQGKVSKIDQVLVNEAGEEACTASFTFGLFDTKTRRLIDPTPEWMSALGVQS